MSSKTPISGISGSTLKLIAILTMLIDHAGATVLRTMTQLPAVVSDPALRSFWSSLYSASRSIGRIAFPIFCFLLVEGFLHTRNVRKYAGRLFLFALISEIPFDLALKGSWYYPEKQNVYFTLLIGLLVLTGMRKLLPERNAALPSCADKDNGTKLPAGGRTALPGRLCFLARGLLCAVILGAGMVLALAIDTDYNYKGVFLIAVLYLMRHERIFQCIGGAAAVSWELPAPAAFLPVLLYNGSRGLQMKYLFYWFYPVHLLLLHAVSRWLIPHLAG